MERKTLWIEHIEWNKHIIEIVSISSLSPSLDDLIHFFLYTEFPVSNLIIKLWSTSSKNVFSATLASLESNLKSKCLKLTLWFPFTNQIFLHTSTSQYMASLPTELLKLELEICSWFFPHFEHPTLENKQAWHFYCRIHSTPPLLLALPKLKLPYSFTWAGITYILISPHSNIFPRKQLC